MANSFTVQTLLNGPRNVILNAVAVLDTSDLAVTDLATLAGFTGPVPLDWRIDSIQFSTSTQLTVQLLWDATADVVAATMYLAGRFDYVGQQALTNNAGAGKTGTLQVRTTGWASGIQSFTLLIHLVKMGV